MPSEPSVIYPARPAGRPPAIWAAFAAQGRWKSWVLAGQLMIIALLVVANIRASTRPPDVVLISPDGKSTYVQSSVATEALLRWLAQTKQEPSDVTTIRFTEHFLRLVLALNSSTIDATWPEALSLMAPQLAAKMRAEAEAKKLLDSVRLARVKTELAFDELILVQRTGDLLHLRARLTRTKRSLLDDGTPSTDHVSADLVARVVPRTLSHPDGLEVAEWTVHASPQEIPHAAP